MIEVELTSDLLAEPFKLVANEAAQLGRDEKLCNVVLQTSGVSKRHCEIACKQTSVVIRDLGSTNGTFVNGRWITESRLHDGDTLELGPKARVKVSISNAGLPTSCEECGKTLTEMEAGRGGRYRDGEGVYCLACVVGGSGAFNMFGPFRLLRPVGDGLTGRVFEAADTRNQSRVALKLLHLPPGGEHQGERAFKRFQREIAVLQKLDHPAIVNYRDSGQVLSQAYLAMEFIDGHDIDQLMTLQDRPFTAGELTPLIDTVTDALTHAHAHDVIHRDVKPGNILKDHDGQIKVTDFGLARKTDSDTLLTSTGSIVGTLEFMAPEQLENAHTIDGRADVYGIAATTFYLLSDKRPFEASNDYQLMMMILNQPVPHLRERWPECPKTIDALLHHAMSRDLDERLPTPAAFAEAWTQAVGS